MWQAPAEADRRWIMNKRATHEDKQTRAWPAVGRRLIAEWNAHQRDTTEIRMMLPPITITHALRHTSTDYHPLSPSADTHHAMHIPCFAGNVSYFATRLPSGGTCSIFMWRYLTFILIFIPILFHILCSPSLHALTVRVNFLINKNEWMNDWESAAISSKIPKMVAQSIVKCVEKYRALKVDTGIAKKIWMEQIKTIFKN